MALLTSAQRIALTVSLFGLLAFLLGVIAENKKVVFLFLLQAPIAMQFALKPLRVLKVVPVQECIFL